jgi:hypothetical protein
LSDFSKNLFVFPDGGKRVEKTPIHCDPGPNSFGSVVTAGPSIILATMALPEMPDMPEMPVDMDVNVDSATDALHGVKSAGSDAIESVADAAGSVSSGVETAAESAVGSAAEAGVESVVESVAETGVESAAQSGVESVAESVVETGVGGSGVKSAVESLASTTASTTASATADAAGVAGSAMAAAGAAVTGVALGSAAKVVSGASGATGAVADALKKPKTGGPNASKGPGRFTPKGSTPAKPGGKKSDSSGEKLPAYASSGRYTAPAEKVAAEEAAFLPTRPWIPWVMFALLAIGGLLIVLNYVGVWPNAPSNWYLLGGIVAITGGFITATQLR